MADHLTRAQRSGAAIFLGLCVLALAAAIWRNRMPPEPAPDPKAEAELMRMLDEMHYASADSLKATAARAAGSPGAPKSHGRGESAQRSWRRKPASGHRKSGDSPKPKPSARSPLDERIPASP